MLQENTGNGDHGHSFTEEERLRRLVMVHASVCLVGRQKRHWKAPVYRRPHQCVTRDRLNFEMAWTKDFQTFSKLKKWVGPG